MTGSKKFTSREHFQMDPIRVAESQPVQAQPTVCKSGTFDCQTQSKPSNKTETTSAFELPLIQTIQENFSASSLLANLYSSTANSNDKSNDTPTTADSTAASQSFDVFLASKEFDASAIITNGEDGDECKAVQDVNISGMSDDFHFEPAVTPCEGDGVQSDKVAVANESPVKKNLVSVPEIDAGDSNAKSEEQSWWRIPSSIQAIWEQITASDHCICLPGSMWNTEESDASKKYQVSVVNEIAESSDKSTSFVIPCQKNQPVTPRTPLQRKVASTSVGEGVRGHNAQPKQYVSPMRIDYLEGNLSSKRTFVTPNPSELSCRSVVTPLIGENLVSTPLHGEDNYENSMISKASSTLFGENAVDTSKASSGLLGEDLFDTNNAKEYCPPPSHLLPSKMPQKELLFLSNNQDTKSSNANRDGVVYKLSESKSQEEKKFGLARSEKIFRRVKDRRRQRRNN